MLSLLLALIESSEDKRKLEEIYHTYKDLMMSIAMKIFRDIPTAEDAVQDTFLRIIKNLDKFNISECHQMRRSIVIYTRSASFDIYRRRKKRNEIPFDDAIEHLSRDDYLPDHLKNNSEYSGVRDVIFELPWQHSDVLALMYLEKYSVTDIANTLGIGESAAKKRLERARDAMRKALEERGFNYAQG